MTVKTLQHRINKYLASYGDADEPALTNIQLSNHFKHFLVIPVYRETPDFLQQYSETWLIQHQCLLVIVSNHPESLSEPDKTLALDAHSNIIDYLDTRLFKSQETTTFSYYQTQNSRQYGAVLVLNYIGDNALPPNMGVGLARKIGNDTLLGLLSQHSNLTDYWLHQTDADAILPDNYFSISDKCKHSAVGMVYPFQHDINSSAVSLATQLYETSLKTHQQGLKTAGSAYTYIPIGSCIAFKASAYVTVRGFPKRAAGEDFYLLNKLNKIAAIESPEKSQDIPPIQLQSRHSDRVPFGTGPGVIALQNQAIDDAKLFYHPEIYTYLQLFIRIMVQVKPMDMSALLANQAIADAHPVQAWCQQSGIEGFFKHVGKQQLRDERYTKAFHDWFDAFRTMKFIHFLRQPSSTSLCSYPNQSKKQLVASHHWRDS